MYDPSFIFALECRNTKFIMFALQHVRLPTTDVFEPAVGPFWYSAKKKVKLSL
jgi:hypothetical protein